MEIYWGDTTAYLPAKKIVIGLERDGVINENVGWLKDPKKFIPIEDSLRAILTLKKKGYYVVILSNQGGIEKGEITIDDVETVNSYMLSLLGRIGCDSIDGLYYSASDKKNDYYAKPNIGMFKRCENENKNISFSNGFYVGNDIDDIKASLKAGARPILILNDKGLNTYNKIKKGINKNLLKKIYTFNSLFEFVQNLD